MTREQDDLVKRLNHGGAHYSDTEAMGKAAATITRLTAELSAARAAGTFADGREAAAKYHDEQQKLNADIANEYAEGGDPGLSEIHGQMAEAHGLDAASIRDLPLPAPAPNPGEKIKDESTAEMINATQTTK